MAVELGCCMVILPPAVTVENRLLNWDKVVAQDGHQYFFVDPLAIPPAGTEENLTLAKRTAFEIPGVECHEVVKIRYILVAKLGCMIVRMMCIIARHVL